MSSSFWDDKSEETFYYSSFPRIQGRILRGTIKYLEALADHDILDEQVLRAAGIPATATGHGEKIRPAIDEALHILRSWVREPSESEGSMFSRMFGGKARLGGKSVVIDSEYPISEMLNAPFYIEKVAELEGCPDSFVQLGLMGVFVALEVSEDRLGVDHEGSKIIVDILDRLEPYTDWEGCGGGDVGSDDSDEEEGGNNPNPPRTTAQQLRAVFAACAANPDSSIVA
ncbi:hypothetical protein MIND_01370700 [Mycena indigotica]|uniref:Uncharacterized protein n=1 Tax=Mycena indigotica TaxID=2126181 RepID=A0A8H6RY83_9AGAR|nr:uncharacterized protein MIND_01370700 [Mycena indigotica]KAF7289955.1 hypothetical protein MIND_01370700 [Mycena indigotica]